MLFLEVHAGGRLIEQQHLGFHGQCAAQLHHFLGAVGEVADDLVARCLQVEKIDDLLHLFAMAHLFARGRAFRPEQRHARQEPGPEKEMAAKEQIVHRAHVSEKLDVLEGAGNAGGGDAVRLAPDQFEAVDTDAAGLRAVEAGYAVEDRGLAGAVGADQGQDLPRGEREPHAMQGLHAAEGDLQAADFQQCRQGGLT